MTTDYSATLLATLRKVCPAKVRVFDAGDDHRDIAISNRRNKWAQAMVAIDARPWVRCELLDKAGAVLGYCEQDGPAGELEDITGADEKEARRDERRLKLMLEAQKIALTYRDKETTELLKGATEILKVNVEAVKQLTILYQAQVTVAADTAAMQATAEAGGDMRQWIELAEASPQIAAAVGPILRLLLARNPTAPANGAPKPPTTPKPTPPTNGTPKAPS